MHASCKVFLKLYLSTGIILRMRPANERRRYNVTSSLIDWAHTQNDLCEYVMDDQFHLFF